jgi:hypothetical protein
MGVDSQRGTHVRVMHLCLQLRRQAMPKAMQTTAVPSTKGDASSKVRRKKNQAVLRLPHVFQY